MPRYYANTTCNLTSVRMPITITTMTNNIVPPAKTDSIVVVGAGIFGLSTAIHLGERGYTNVCVFDKQPYEETVYSYLNGCDAASAGKRLCFPCSVRCLR